MSLGLLPPGAFLEGAPVQKRRLGPGAHSGAQPSRSSPLTACLPLPAS